MAKTANSILGQIRRCFTFKTREILVNLYKTFVRTQMEHCVQLWSPWLLKDIEILEKVQRRAVRMIPGLQGTYEEKLKEIGLPSFKQRRERGDAIQVFKILHGFDNVDYKTWFEFVGEVNVRSSRSVAEAKLAIPMAQTESRRNFFTFRACRAWNSLPIAIRQNINTHFFKIDYDMFYLTDDEGPPHYVP